MKPLSVVYHRMTLTWWMRAESVACAIDWKSDPCFDMRNSFSSTHFLLMEMRKGLPFPCHMSCNCCRDDLNQYRLKESHGCLKLTCWPWHGLNWITVLSKRKKNLLTCFVDLVEPWSVSCEQNKRINRFFYWASYLFPNTPRSTI